MPTLYVMSGIQGSGKSTVAGQISEEHDAVVLSSDKIRLELFGDESAQLDNNKVFETLYDRARSLLSEDKNVIIDAMNISRKRRMHLLSNEFRKIECKRIIVYVATPLEKCIENDSNRSRTVTEKVIKKTYRNMQVPIRSEGWDDIWYALDEYEKEPANPSLSWWLEVSENPETFESNIAEIVPVFKGLYNLSHDNPHHSFSVGRHIYYTLKNVRELFNKLEDKTNMNYELLTLSALFHDVGKKHTKRFMDSKGEYSEYAHFYNHEKVSAQIAVSELLRLRYPKEIVEGVNELVQFHMDLYKAPKKNGKRKVEYAISKERYELLKILHEADTMAH